MAGPASQVSPGTRLGTKEELRNRCGVSVGTFNETLRLLQVRGVVTVQRGPGGGLFAAEQSPLARLAYSVLALDVSPTSVSEALRICGALEPLVWQDALRHASPADVAELRLRLDQMDAAANKEDTAAFLRANWHLHTRVAAITPSDLLSSLYVGLVELVEQHLLTVQPHSGVPLGEHLRRRGELHAAMIDALDDRDEETLLELVRQHDLATSTGMTCPLPAAAIAVARPLHCPSRKDGRPV